MRFLLLLVLTVFLLPVASAHAGEHFEKARELYAQGTSAAPGVLRELDLELKDNPENDKALMLRAITQRGVGDLDGSQRTLDRLESVYNKQGILDPTIYELRMENLGFKKDYTAARKLADTYEAFFEKDGALKRRYEVASKGIDMKLAQLNFAVNYFQSAKGAPPKDGFIVLVEAEDFARFKTDKDLAEPLSSAVENGDSSAVIFIPEKPGVHPVESVFFKDGKAQASLTSSKSRKREDIREAAVASKKSFLFKPGTLTADDGTPIVAYQSEEVP